PLTDSALNNLLASCEKERVVKSHALNAMKSNVDRIVYQSKIVWPEGGVDYKRYQEFFSCDRDITKDDLVALEEVISKECRSRFWKFEIFLLWHFRIEGELQIYDDLLLAIREHIAQVMRIMGEQHRDIVKYRKDWENLRDEMKLVSSGQTVWHTEFEELECMDETVVAEAHEKKTDEEKTKKLKDYYQEVICSPGMIAIDMETLITRIRKLCIDFERKKEILKAFSERLAPESQDCLARQPVNLIVLFLKSLGVETPPLAQTLQEVDDIFADIIDRRPFRSEFPVPDRYLQEGLEDLFALQV
ncbi:MAG: hypothetical protein OXC30_03445, partial [Alphaproteobacteria bacterium]|nr:hypothetical protein [Alphaproteobacteria bacterium]